MSRPLPNDLAELSGVPDLDEILSHHPDSERVDDSD
jgi:hypothetical protein